MLGASAYFAFKIYEHVQTLQDPKTSQDTTSSDNTTRGLNSFSPFNAEQLIQKADDALVVSDYDKALSFLLEADEKKPSDADVLFRIGYILDKKDDKDEALNYYKKALEFDKNNEYIYNSIASIYRYNKEYTSAQMRLRDSLAINDKNPITYYNYANLLVDMDNKEEAITMYKKALELNPDFKEAKEELEKLS